MKSEKERPGKIIAIDFDGTCVTHAYPMIGAEIGAAPVLRELDREGHKLLLWTMRSGEQLKEAIKWFIDSEIELWASNRNPTQAAWTSSPKAYANLYIDDAGLGMPLRADFGLSDRPFVDWDKTLELLIQHQYLSRTNS